MDFLPARGIIIVLKRQSAEFFSDKLTATFSYANDEVSNLDVVDREKFVGSLSAFLAKNAFEKNDALVFLSPEVVFQKEIIKSKNQDSEIADFENQVPLEVSHRVTIKIPRLNGTVVASTNKRLVEAVVEALNGRNCRVLAVSPLALITDFAGQPPWDTKSLSKAYRHVNGYAKYSFLESHVGSEPEETSGEIGESPSPGKTVSARTVVLILLVILAMGILGASFFFSGKLFPVTIKQPIQPDRAGIKTTLVNSEVATASAETIDRIVKIQVLNGSGVSGQAGVVKKELTKLGYDNVSTGNATGSSQTKTEIIFAPSVSDVGKSEIRGLLEKLFTAITSIDATSSSGYVIKITTGEPKP